MDSILVIPFAREERRRSLASGRLQRIASAICADHVDIVEKASLGYCVACHDRGRVIACNLEACRGATTVRADWPEGGFEVAAWSDADGHWLCGRRARERRGYPHLLFRRDKRNPAFTPAQREQLLSVLPETLEWLAAGHELSRLRGEVHYIGRVFENLPIALLIIDDHLRVLAANRAGSKLLQCDDGLGLVNGILRLPRESGREVAHAVLRAEPLHLDLPRPSGAPPYVVRLFSAARTSLGERPMAALVVRDAAAVPTQPCPVVGRAFGLTRAEARLAYELVRGSKLVEAAVRLGISRNTARTHMKRIYAKTGAAHQAELVRLLAGMMTEV